MIGGPAGAGSTFVKKDVSGTYDTPLEIRGTEGARTVVEATGGRAVKATGGRTVEATDEDMTVEATEEDMTIEATDGCRPVEGVEESRTVKARGE